ncbi:MAG: hypothetical protein V1928_04900 [Parcubacteria group bacterium]
MKNFYKSIFRKSNLNKLMFVGVIALTLILTANFNALATQNDSYGYGYGPEGYSYGYGYWSETTPSVTMSYAGCTSSCTVNESTAVTITATFSSAPSGTPDIQIDYTGTGNDLSYTAMSGTGTSWTYSYTTPSLTVNTEGTVTIRTLAGSGYTPSPSNSVFTVNDVSGGGGSLGGATAPSAPTTTTTTTTTAASVTTPVATISVDPAKVQTILTTFNLTANAAEEAKYLAFAKSDAAAFKVVTTADQLAAITNFETYGISTATIALGAGERRALIRDYMETVGRAEVVWNDIERMSVGQKPVTRNLAKEQAKVNTVLSAFKKVVGHNPVFSNSKEDLAWNTMMYRIRFTRDLTKEKAGIVKFKSTFKRIPTSPLDWSVVRSIGYAL